MYLDVLVEHVVERFAPGNFRDGGFDCEFFHRGKGGCGHVIRVLGPIRRRLLYRRIDQAGGPIQQAFDGIRPRGHHAQLLFDGAEAGNRLPELLSRGRIPCGFADGAGGAADARRAELEPAEVEHVERHFMAFADLAEHIRRRHARILQQQRGRRRAVQSHLVFFMAAADAGKRTLDDERGEVLAVHFRKHDKHVGEPAVGDPHLLAVQRKAAVSGFGGARARA